MNKLLNFLKCLETFRVLGCFQKMDLLGPDKTKVKVKVNKKEKITTFVHWEIKHIASMSSVYRAQIDLLFQTASWKSLDQLG